MGKQINVEWDSIRHRFSVEPRQVCFLPSKQLLLTWLPDVQSSTLHWCRGVSIMASMQVRIQLTAISHLRCTWHKVWCFLVFFDKHFVKVHIYIRSSDDINVKALRFNRNCSGVSAWSLLSNTTSPSAAAWSRC